MLTRRFCSNWTRRWCSSWERGLSLSWERRLSSNWTRRLSSSWERGLSSSWERRLCSSWTRRLCSTWTRRLCSTWARELFVEKKSGKVLLSTIEKRMEENVTENEKSRIRVVARLRQQLDDELDELEQMEQWATGSDVELARMAQNDRCTLSENVDSLCEQLVDAVLPLTELDVLPKCQLELTCGVGGVESMIFTKQLFEMYNRYATFRQWNWSPMNVDLVSPGGLRSALVALSGQNVYRDLRYEAGIHRVQRCPVTDPARMHTSTASITVLPEPEQVEAFVSPTDLHYESMRASGPGGQNVNKRSTAIRLTHTPTGISVHCMDERTQHQNRQIALQRLAAILYEQKVEKMMQKHSSARKLQVGSKARAEKIRTYNFKDGRVTDHRLRRSIHQIEEFMKGESVFDGFIAGLRELDKQERIQLMMAVDGQVS